MTVSIQIEDRSIVVTPDPAMRSSLTRDELVKAIQAVRATQEYLQRVQRNQYAPEPGPGPRWRITEEGIDLIS